MFSSKAAVAYLFAGLVPGLFAYAAYSYLASAFGALSTSLSLYLGPVVGALLSIIFLGEAPSVIHLIGGALVARRHVAEPARVRGPRNLSDDCDVGEPPT